MLHVISVHQLVCVLCLNSASSGTVLEGLPHAKMKMQLQGLKYVFEDKAWSSFPLTQIPPMWANDTNWLRRKNIARMVALSCFIFPPMTLLTRDSGFLQKFEVWWQYQYHTPVDLEPCYPLSSLPSWWRVEIWTSEVGFDLAVAEPAASTLGMNCSNTCWSLVNVTGLAINESIPCE